MESEGLKQFLNVVGDAVHSVNTLCVGLTSVSQGTAKKPDDLTITWSTQNPGLAAAKARTFALRASLVFVEEALPKYLDFLELCAFEDGKLQNALRIQRSADRVSEVARLLPQKEDYWEPMVVLLVRWRNRVVHNSQADLSALQRKKLMSNAEALAKNHANIDIEESLKNFNSNRITLKDFTTLIAITIRFVRSLDEQIEPKIRTLDGFKQRLQERDLTQTFKQVMSANGEETRRRKFEAFLRTEFSALGDGFEEEVYENWRSVVSTI